MTSTEVLTLEYVTDRSSCGHDDPCLCTDAYDAGPKFLPQWSGAVGSGTNYNPPELRNQRKCYSTVRTGCLVNIGDPSGPTVQVATGDVYVIAQRSSTILGQCNMRMDDAHTACKSASHRRR